MRLSFTRSDLATFALGALAAVLVPLGTALAQLDNDPVTDYGTWAMGLLTGIGAALGRYLATAVPAARAPIVPVSTGTSSPASRHPLPRQPFREDTGNRPMVVETNTVGDIVAKKTREQPPAG